MTTAAELGLATPQGTDFISQGDNAITQNANKLAELYDHLNILPLEAATTSTNITAVRGYQRVTNTTIATALGLPAAPGIFGGFDLLAGGASRVETYLALRAKGVEPDLYIRNRAESTYSRWKNVSTNEPQTLTSSSIVDTLATGTYLISNRIVATDLGMPVAAPGMLHHTKLGNGWMEFFTTIDNNPVESFTYQRAKSLNGVIQPWRRLANAGEGAQAGDSAGPVRRDLLQQAVIARKGGVIGTAGKGVITLRFDDAPADFVTKILPLLQERNLPFTRVSTSDSIASTGEIVTDAKLTEMQDYCIQSGGEVWNHGRDHANATGESAIYDNLIGALDKLRTKMPRIPVDCFSPPGGSVTYDGHMPSNAITNWADTYAGRMLMAHHAIASGYFQDTYYRPLDGVLRDGQIHYSVDAYTDATATALVDRARDWGKGVVMMWHAHNLDTSGKMTTAQLTTVLDYVAAQRDAGNILVLTKSGMSVAQIGSSYRDNLLTKATGNPFTETMLYPQFRQNVPGSTRELTATVTGTAGTTVTSVIGESTKTHTIPAGGTLALRHVATIPLDATALTVSIDATTTNAKLLAV